MNSRMEWITARNVNRKRDEVSGTRDDETSSDCWVEFNYESDFMRLESNYEI